MSDSSNNPPGDNRYGQSAEPPSDPYGQQQPPAYGGSGQEPYSSGYQPYGQQPYGATPYGTGDPDKRPGTVTAASIITIVFSSLAVVLFVVLLIAMVASRDRLLDEIWQALQDQGQSGDLTRGDLDNAWGVIIAIPVILAVWALIATITAALAFRRHNWARIVTVVSAVVTAILSLLAIGSVISGLTLIAAVAAIVLYFVGGANQWYSRKNQAPTPPPRSGQWG